MTEEEIKQILQECCYVNSKEITVNELREESGGIVGSHASDLFKNFSVACRQKGNSLVAVVISEPRTFVFGPPIRRALELLRAVLDKIPEDFSKCLIEIHRRHVAFSDTISVKIETRSGNFYELAVYLFNGNWSNVILRKTHEGTYIVVGAWLEKISLLDEQKALEEIFARLDSWLKESK